MMSQMLFAAGGDSITLHGVTYYGIRVGANCSVSYTITGSLTSEEIYTDEFGTTVPLGSWLTPSTNASLYEVRMSLVSGTFTTGTVGSWLPMSTGYTWLIQRTSVGVKQTVATIEVRSVASGSVLATATVDLTAERA